jgi:hypothetical protein
MFNGVIDSREVRMTRGASSSENTCRTSRQDAKLARLRQKVAQRDVYYADYIATQQTQFTNLLIEKLQVSMNYCL